MAFVTEEKIKQLRAEMVAYRARENISQIDLAKRCGLSVSTIQTMESGTLTPNARSYMKVKLVVSPQEM